MPLQPHFSTIYFEWHVSIQEEVVYLEKPGILLMVDMEQLVSYGASRLMT